MSPERVSSGSDYPKRLAWYFKFRYMVTDKISRRVVFVAAALGAPACFGANYINPVRAGDFPDPSVIRTADGYWATATSSEWAPGFPLLHSDDLVNWEVRGSVFPTPPNWAIGSFWAPEISEYKGRYFVYYTARRKDRRLAVAVATADFPGGPYTDHGELVAQQYGSIDAMPFTDQDGVRWLVWKEDGNSEKKPTILWLQRLRDDGLALVGERRELFRNDTPWEGAVVEGPFVLFRDGYYYLFYSGAGCCGRGCNYALGVARARALAGPWEKDPANPILTENEAWRCPGHGSIVRTKAGRYWLLYHAYPRDGFVATGREMVLDEVVFGGDGWPTINGGRGTSLLAPAPSLCAEQRIDLLRRDDFDRGDPIGSEWQWPLRHRPAVGIARGVLSFAATEEPGFLAQSVPASSFVAETAFVVDDDAEGGVAVIGDPGNYLSFSVGPKRSVVKVVRRRNAEVVAAAAGVAAGQRVRLRVASRDGHEFRFAYATDGGDWNEVKPAIDGSALPPWDRGLRCGLTAEGRDGKRVGFDYFLLRRGGEGLLAE